MGKLISLGCLVIFIIIVILIVLAGLVVYFLGNNTDLLPFLNNLFQLFS